MPSQIHPSTCASCRAEFHHPATFHTGVAFCCAGCVAGGPCVCSYDEEPIEPERAGAVRAEDPARRGRPVAPEPRLPILTR